MGDDQDDDDDELPMMLIRCVELVCSYASRERELVHRVAFIGMDAASETQYTLVSNLREIMHRAAVHVDVDVSGDDDDDDDDAKHDLSRQASNRKEQKRCK